MSALLCLVVIIPTAAGFCVLLRCRMEEGIPAACLFLLSLGYLAVLPGGSPLLGAIPWAGCLAGTALVLRQIAAHQRIDLHGWLQGIVLFGILAVFFWWLCRGCQYTDWDDFSHWGKAVKWLYSTNTLLTAPAAGDTFASYPPMTAVWQVMLMKATGSHFREDISLYANALLTAGWLLLPFRTVRIRKKPVAGILTFVFLGLAPMLVYPSYFYRASVDGLLGVFAAGLLLALFLPARSPGSDFLLIAGCFVLTLIKSSGAGIALIIAVAYIVERGRLPGQGSGLRHRLLPVLPLAAVAAAQISWSLHKRFFNVGERWASAAPASGLYRLLTGNAASWQSDVLRSFAATIFAKPNYGRLNAPFIAWPAALVLLAALAYCLTRHAREKVPLVRLTVWTLLLAGVYVLGLLYSYLFVFDASEASVLASVYRYLDTVTLMLLLVGAAALGAAAASCSLPVQILPVSYFALAVLMLPFFSTLQEIVWAPTHAAKTQQSRYLAQHAAQRIEALDVENPRLWLITANDGGFAALQIEYELLPQHLPTQAYILMETVPPGNPWARQISKEEFSRELAAGYDYLYIYCPEDQFVRDYLPVFEESSQSEVVVDRMFAVIRQPDGTALLRCIDAF